MNGRCRREEGRKTSQAYEHKLFVPVGLGTAPDLSLGQTQVSPPFFPTH